MVYINGEFSTPQQLKRGLRPKIQHRSLSMKSFGKSLVKLISDERVVVAFGVLVLAVIESTTTKED